MDLFSQMISVDKLSEDIGVNTIAWLVLLELYFCIMSLFQRVLSRVMICLLRSFS